MRVCEVCGGRFRGGADKCPLDGGKLVDAPDPLLGQTIGGRYVIEERIGAGGMGTVYRARHEVVGRDVAVKFLAAELAHDRRNRARFLREARAANRINHEHIIHITDYGETDDGRVYLVMEYLEGTPLDVEIGKRTNRRGAMRPERALSIVLQASMALGRAHELGVIHRDIKPENVFLLRSYGGDFVKLLDFGLAHMKDELRVTVSGSIFGTPEYVSPEQARGAQATAASDLYSLGCMLYEMLTGRLPFDGQRPELVFKHLHEQPQPPSIHVPDIPKAVDALVLELLEKDPEKRLGNAYRMAERVRAMLAELGVPTTDGGHRVQRRKSGRQPVAVVDAASAAPQNAQRQGDTHKATAGTTSVDSDSNARTLSIEESWDQRIQLLHDLMLEAYPRGDGPDWLAPAVDQLETHLKQLRRVRAQRSELASEAARQEEEVRQMRLRIGHALDELAREHARIAEQEQQTRRRLEDARDSRAMLLDPLLELWQTLPPPPRSKKQVAIKEARALFRAGELAGWWLEAEQTRQELGPALDRLAHERQDLHSQIERLKERLTSINADWDSKATDLKQRTLQLDRQLNEWIDCLVRDAKPVVQHFLSFPALRKRLLDAGSPGLPGAAAR